MGATREQGGAVAIKGFLFQFDHTIAEILAHPRETITFEQKEDIEREDYYIQVKNLEASSYAPSRIRRPVAQLLAIFRDHPTKYYRLHCHFKDKAPCIWQPAAGDLTGILDSEGVDGGTSTLDEFSKHLLIEFADDYEAGFANLLLQIKDAFDARTDDLAITYHAILRSHLLDLSIKTQSERRACLSDLRDVVLRVKRRVSMAGYQELLGSQGYERLLRKAYFTHTRANVDNFERLFVLDCDGTACVTDLIRLIYGLSRRYFIVGKSPQPYVLFRGLDCAALTQIKQALVDRSFFFCDGTFFHGDKVHMDSLFQSCIHDKSKKIKFLPAAELLTSERIASHFDETYDLYTCVSLEVRSSGKKHIQIPVSDSAQILRILGN